MLVLGANGSKSDKANITSFLITPEILIDCGNIFNGLGERFLDVKHIFISHTHFDHIADLPLVLDTYFARLKHPIKIYGTHTSIQNLRNHIFNDVIWPDFSQITIPGQNNTLIEFVPLNYGKPVTVKDVTIEPIKNNHSQGSCGFIINEEMLITSDTYVCDQLWERVNSTPGINKIITEVSFQNRHEKLAALSRHLTPKSLEQELGKLNRQDVSIYLHHIKESDREHILQEIQALSPTPHILQDGEQIRLASISDIPYRKSRQDLYTIIDKQTDHIQKLNEIGVALSYERNIDKLLEMILHQAKAFTNADAGTLYLMSEDERKLEFKVVMTDSLGIKMGGTASEISWPPLELYDKNGTPNNEMVAAVAALKGRIINIDDVYYCDEFNFSGTKKFDASTGFRSRSMLVIPMKNSDDEVIGVCQLINRQNTDKEITSFSREDEFAIKALSSQAAVAITNTKLIVSLENLLDSFIKSIASAIDAKSPYTGGHVKKVAVITDMIAQAINDDSDGDFKDIYYDKEKLRELQIAALMHDVGKIATPTHIMDKATKLETICDRIELIKERFELYKTQLQLSFAQHGREDTDNLKARLRQIDEDFAFLEEINIGGEFMSDDKINRLHKIASQKITLMGQEHNLLSQDEVYNLAIRKGTLTDEEMQIMRDHARISNDMLSQLPFPKKLSQVPAIASGHHEKLNGKGYPNGLDADELSLEARILAIADIFEALSASDRPYKEAKSMEQIMKIIGFMIKDGELDERIVRLFYANNLHWKYARNFLKPNQYEPQG